MNTQEAITRYRSITKIETDTKRDLAGVKRRIISELSADQLEELAAAVYGESGSLGTPVELVKVVERG
jgi:hypothetical protein